MSCVYQCLDNRYNRIDGKLSTAICRLRYMGVEGQRSTVLYSVIDQEIGF
jgi:hypothetical protein